MNKNRCTMEQDKFVINIGRQLGSGGKAVGEALGRRLGVHVYDKQLINLAAEQSGLCTELFEQADEKKSRSLFSSLIGYLRMPFGGDECGMTDVLSSEALFKMQSDVIRDIASRESCIFRGPLCRLHFEGSSPRGMFFVTGAPEDRVRRLCEQENVTPEEAEAQMERTDTRRASYYDYFSSGKWGEAATYHLCIDSSVLGIEGTADFIREFAERKLKMNLSGR